MNEKKSIEKIILGIYISKAVITDSYHRTIFSLIFDKPFVAFLFKVVLKKNLFLSKKHLKSKTEYLKNFI